MTDENPLHRARLDRGLDLTELARRTCLSPRILEQIDQGRFDELPAGIYARAYVRTVASAVGLEPDAAVAAVAGRLPPAADPLTALRGGARPSPPAWIVLVTAWTCSTSVWLGSTTRERGRLLRVVARALDAAVLLLTHAALVSLTALISGAPAGAVLNHPGVTLLWIVLVCLYFLLLEGIGGRTFGTWAVGARLESRAPAGLRTILSRGFLF